MELMDKTPGEWSHIMYEWEGTHTTTGKKEKGKGLVIIRFNTAVDDKLRDTFRVMTFCFQDFKGLKIELLEELRPIPEGFTITDAASIIIDVHEDSVDILKNKHGPLKDITRVRCNK